MFKRQGRKNFLYLCFGSILLWIRNRILGFISGKNGYVSDYKLRNLLFIFICIKVLKRFDILFFDNMDLGGHHEQYTQYVPVYMNLSDFRVFSQISVYSDMFSLKMQNNLSLFHVVLVYFLSIFTNIISLHMFNSFSF